MSARLRMRLSMLRMDFGHWRERRLCDLARHLPAGLRVWVVVDSAVVARNLYPGPDGYAGPDGLTYRHLHDGARRQRSGS